MKLIGYAVVASILGFFALVGGVVCALYVLSQI